MPDAPRIRLSDVDGTAVLPIAELSARTGVPLLEPGESCDLLLYYQEAQLRIQECTERASGVVSVDFENEALRYRQRRQSQPEALLKAAGVRQGHGCRVLDATAGLGLDAFLFASAGCQVTLFERSAVLHALLSDGLRRGSLSQDARIREATARMTLHLGDSLEAMQNASPSPEIVYLDPMFPERRKSAKVKKEMALLQQLLHGEEKEAGLLSAALRCAGKRVVVKRPRLAPWLEERKPSWQLEGKSSRFDVYLCPASAT